MARQPNSQTYELGHWESMVISQGLFEIQQMLQIESEQATDMQEKLHTLGRLTGVKELYEIFATGTHTVTHKLEEM